MVWYLVFVFSTTCHEAAHAFAALKLGDSTAYEGGQVSLNPLPHIRREPFGMVLIPLVSYFMAGWMIGWASAPYDPNWALRYPKKSALMALAGPVANFILVVLAGVGIRIGLATGTFAVKQDATFLDLLTAASGGGALEALASALWIAFLLNLLLGLFNLFPVPPLDGSAVIQLFLPDSIARRYQQFLWSQPMLAWAGILIAWKLFDYVFWPVLMVATSLLLPGG